MSFVNYCVGIRIGEQKIFFPTFFQKSLAISSKLCYNIHVRNTEAYRSGHNGTDSKSVVPHGTVGSNPTASAKTKEWCIAPLFCFAKTVVMRTCIPNRRLGDSSESLIF